MMKCKMCKKEYLILDKDSLCNGCNDLKCLGTFKPNKKIVWASFLFMFIFMVSFASAVTWDNTAYYRFEDTSGDAVDAVAGTYDIKNNGVTFNVLGKVNRGFSFDGTNDYLGNISEIDLGSVFSIAMWVKLNDSTTEKYYLGNGQKSGADYNSLTLYQGSGKISLAADVSTDSSSTYTTDNVILGTNRWIHIVVTRAAGASPKIYINGTEVAGSTADNWGGTIDYDGDDFYIGTLDNGGSLSGYFNGSMDEVGLWSRELTSSEVSELYNSGNGLIYGGAGARGILGVCNASLIYPILNISFKDEGNLSVLEASIPTSTFTWYQTNNVSNTGEFSLINNTNNLNYTFCSNIITNFTIDPIVQYKKGTEYPQRIWDPAATNYAPSTQQTLYLLNTVDGIYVTFQFATSNDALIEDVAFTAVRSISGGDVTIGQGTSGADGTITLWLNPDFSHTFTATHDDYTSWSSSFPPTQSSYTITMASGTGNVQNSTFQGIDYSSRPLNTFLTNDTVYQFAFNLTSSIWDVTDYGFNLRLANGTIITGDNTGVEGTDLTLNYNTTNKSIIYMDYYWVINGNYTNATRYWVIQNSEYTDWSISKFFTDLNSYLDDGLFGLDNFGRYLFVFLIIFMTVGIMSYKYGLSSPMAVTTLIFGIVFFFEVVVNIIPSIRGIDNLLTYIAALMLILAIFREVQK